MHSSIHHCIQTAIITGATSGLGFETAFALAKLNWHVILTGRNHHKGQSALQRIRSEHPEATVEYEHLDLASLKSISEFSNQLHHRNLRNSQIWCMADLNQAAIC